MDSHINSIKNSEVARFIVIGILNTLVDFAVLNLLLYIFSFVGLKFYPIFKSISFILAVMNSYYFNKYWVFLSHSKPTFHESSKFFIVNITGLFLNLGASSLGILFTLSLFPDISRLLVANIGAFCGTATVAVMNFLSYKHLVFRKIGNSNG